MFWNVFFLHLQVDLEPHGKVRIIVELKWHGMLTSCLFLFFSRIHWIDGHLFIQFQNKAIHKAVLLPPKPRLGRINSKNAPHSTDVVVPCEDVFIRYVCQHISCKSSTKTKFIWSDCFYFRTGQWAQIYGYISASTNVLFALQRIYLVISCL